MRMIDPVATILIIDDEPGIRHITSMIIKQNDLDSPQVPLHTVEAGNGAEGLGLLFRHHPELVILDNRLPDMNGSEWIERSGLIWPAAVILISASAELESIARTHPVVVGMLAKPFKLAELRMIIHKVLSRLLSKNVPS